MGIQAKETSSQSGSPERLRNLPAMPITRGFLQVKKKGALKGSWTSHLCEYDPDTKLLKVKGSDNKTTLLEKGLLRAWVQDNKSNQDKYRFNVRTSDDETMTLAGSSQNDMDRWIDVSD